MTHLTLHQFLDDHYGSDGDEVLARRLSLGESLAERSGLFSETPLHVATRRRRARAIRLLLDHGCDIDARTSGNKTAFAHASRRGFGEIAELLRGRGADTALNPADSLAIAVVEGRLADARSIRATHPNSARTGNPEEDRLLADVAGRNAAEPVELLIGFGADLTVPGLDDGTPLHQAAWFGQPRNAALLIAAGAPLDVFDSVHGSSPLGWVTHGSRYSGGSSNRQDQYVELAHLLLAAGSGTHYPGDEAGDAYRSRLLKDATPPVAEVLRAAF